MLLIGRAALIVGLLVSAARCTAAGAEGRVYWVAPDGDDASPGTTEKPLRTIRKAAEVMEAGDTCRVRGGVYRETVRPKNSGAPERPMRFVAQPGELVVLSGAEPVAGAWELHEGKIYKTACDGPVTQLFLDGKALVEARWPNMPMERLWDRSCWARAAKGSRYGKMVDPELAKTGVDWTGAVAALNVAHQFYTWTRTVDRHVKGGDAFEYARDFAGVTNYADRPGGWEDDRYYLFGKLEALDSPGEWFCDAEKKTLYFWAPGGDSPAAHVVEVKARGYGFETEKQSHIEISGFHFFACSFRFEESSHCRVEACHLRYPSFARRLSEEGAKEDAVFCTMTGDHNSVVDSSFAFGSTAGLLMIGSAKRVENCLFHDFSWAGSLRYAPLRMRNAAEDAGPEPSVARHNTLFNCGNAILSYNGPGHILELNHLWDGGLACKDVALLYTGGPATAGNICRYNWVHGCRTEDGHGLGIRGDDQTRSLTVHHNVVWNCGRDGIIVKGDNNQVHNNTVFNIGKPQRPGNYISLHIEPEPKKPWVKQHPLLPVQNPNTRVFNNAALTITGDRVGTPFKFTQNMACNYHGKDLKLMDPGRFDFRPRADSPLVDAGKEIPGFTEGFKGKAPDIGAYEHGGERWVPGCRNGLRVWQAGGAVQVALRMPPFEKTSLEVTRGGAEVAALEFTPDDWMKPRQLDLPAGTGEVVFADEHLGRAAIEWPIGNDGLAVWFDRPMLPTGPAIRKEAQ